MAKKPTSGPSTTKPLYEGTAEAHKHSGGPAFPLTLAVGDEVHKYFGLSIRDWFAGMALMGDIADHAGGVTNAGRAEWCYEMADAMLAEREKADG